jgi:hypothetical protein
MLFHGGPPGAERISDHRGSYRFSLYPKYSKLLSGFAVKETLKVINQMQRDGVIGQYAIGGAVGALYYLETASTVDIDVFVVLPRKTNSSLLDLSPIYDYLRRKGFKPANEAVLIGIWPVQFLPPADALEEEALVDAIDADVEDVPTRVMTAEYLVAIALKTGRAKDHARVEAFIRQKAVNLAKLKAVLSRHGLTGKWEAFQKQYPSR